MFNHYLYDAYIHNFVVRYLPLSSEVKYECNSLKHWKNANLQLIVFYTRFSRINLSLCMFIRDANLHLQRLMHLLIQRPST